MESLISNLIRPYRFSYSILDLGKKYTDQYIRQDSSIFNQRGLKINYSYYKNITMNNNKQNNQDQDNICRQSEVCLIYAHCNSGCRVQGIPLLQSVMQARWNFCIFDFTGSGLSDGQFISLGYYQAYDLEAIVGMLKNKYNNQKIVLWGRSMGAATILHYLSFTKQIQSIVGCVLDSPYSNLCKLIKQVGKSQTKLPEFILQQVIELMRNRIIANHHYDIKSMDLLSKVSKIHIPTMFITSPHDNFITSNNVSDLYNRISSKNKVLEYIYKQHNSPRSCDTFKAGVQFLKRSLLEKNKTKKHLKILSKNKSYFTIINGGSIAEMILKTNKNQNRSDIFSRNKPQIKVTTKFNEISNNNNNCEKSTNEQNNFHRTIKRFHSFSHIGLSKKNSKSQNIENIKVPQKYVLHNKAPPVNKVKQNQFLNQMQFNKTKKLSRIKTSFQSNNHSCILQKKFFPRSITRSIRLDQEQINKITQFQEPKPFKQIHTQISDNENSPCSQKYDSSYKNKHFNPIRKRLKTINTLTIKAPFQMKQYHKQDRQKITCKSSIISVDHKKEIIDDNQNIPLNCISLMKNYQKKRCSYWEQNSEAVVDSYQRKEKGNEDRYANIEYEQRYPYFGQKKMKTQQDATQRNHWVSCQNMIEQPSETYRNKENKDYGNLNTRIYQKKNQIIKLRLPSNTKKQKQSIISNKNDVKIIHLSPQISKKDKSKTKIKKNQMYGNIV